MKGYQDVGMPMELQMVAGVKDKFARFQIAEAFKTKNIDDKLNKAVGVEAGDVRKQVAEEINSNAGVQNLTKSIMATGSPAANIEKVKNIKEIIQKMTFINIMKGDKPSVAVDKATKMVIVDEFYFSDVNPYRVPKAENITPDVADVVLNNIKKGLSLDDVFIEPGTDPDTARWTMEGIRDGYWASSGDNKGFVLKNPTTHLPVIGKDNKPITVSYETVRKYKEDPTDKDKINVNRLKEGLLGKSEEQINTMKKELESEIAERKERMSKMEGNQAYKLQYDTDQRIVRELENKLKAMGK